MVAQFQLSRIRGALVAGCLAFFSIAASPAAAQGSTQATQIVTSVHVADGIQAPLGEGDEEFRELFSSWKALDHGLVAPLPQNRVSVPSRMPIEGFTLTSGYGMRNHPVLGGRRNHKGVDLAAPTGTPVYATGDGVVSMAQWFGAYGKYVQIEHGAEMQTRFAHLSSYVVQPGERVRKGDLIGHVGSTGRSTGPHLHYEVRLSGVAVNPLPYMIGSEAREQIALVVGEGGQGGPE